MIIDSVLRTKLFLPPARPNLVRRQRLVDRLNSMQRLALIAAPAGFGKTTLLSEWIPQSQHCVTWISLDDGDNDSTRFWSYIIAALQMLRDDLGESALGLLQSPQPLPATAILTTLINEVVAFDEVFTLVLDDYHTVTNPTIHQGLTYLLEHLPPQMRLVLISRADPPLPLGRWRASGQLTEIRADDLRFTMDESTTFLNQVMGLGLSAPDIAALETRNEGWIAGLQLAVLSMQGRDDLPAFIGAFSGSHKHVLTYLAEEVLNRRPPGTLDFLIRTSILDRMTGALCDALTGRNDGQQVLEALEQANLFVVPLDDERNWFRYHHLFADVLRQRLAQAEKLSPSNFGIAALHRRASQWYEQTRFADEALRHLLAIPDYDLAASLVERHTSEMIFRSETVQLQTWLAQLPDELIRSRVRLTLARGWTLIFTEQWEAAEQVLTSAVLRTPNLPAEIAGEMTMQRAMMARFRGDSQGAFRLAQEALKQLPLESQGMRAGALLEIGLAQKRQGKIAAASQTLAEVAALDKSGEYPYVTLIALEALHMIQAEKGLLSEVAKTCQKEIRMISEWRGRSIPAAGMAYIGLGEVLCEWNDLDRAGAALEQGLKLIRRTIEKVILFRGYAALARVYQGRGDPISAHGCIQRAEEWFWQMHMAVPGIMARLAAQQAKLWIWQENLSAAARWADSGELPTGDAAEALTLSREDEYLVLARVYIAQERSNSGGERATTALRLLDRLLQAAEVEGRTGSLIEILSLRALAWQARGDLEAALHAIKGALCLAEAEGYVRIFVDEGEPMRTLIRDLKVEIEREGSTGCADAALDLLPYIVRLLSAFPGAITQETAHSPLIEPLSERELEVLMLVAEGASNREIAKNLYLATGTVKTHLKHIYGKLSVGSRTQAIARARDLLLI